MFLALAQHQAISSSLNRPFVGSYFSRFACSRWSVASLLRRPRRGFSGGATGGGDGSFIGNINVPQAAKSLPASFKPLSEEVGAHGVLHLDPKRNAIRKAALNSQTLATLRFGVAHAEGNGVNLRGQDGKGESEALSSACSG